MYSKSPRSIQSEAGGTDHINNNPRATHTETEMGVADRAETRVNHRTTEAGGADHNTEKQRNEHVDAAKPNNTQIFTENDNEGTTTMDTLPPEDPWALPELKDTGTPWKGKTAGKVFQNSELLQNPICGVMIGVLTTVLVQSSSTTTSIVVSMVAADILTVKLSIPIVMGANIGTSVTNTIVSLGEITHRNDFRRAFAGATVHDMFNWLSVIVLLPLEVATGYLYHLSGAVIESMQLATYEDANKDLLKAATKPFTKLIIEVDSKKINMIAKGDGKEDYRLLKTCCRSKSIPATNETGYNFTQSICLKNCSHLFVDSPLSDSEIGIIMLVLSLALLCLCLFGIVKLLNSLLHGNIRRIIKKFVNYDFPGKAAYFTGYIAIVIGMGFTILVQSSSIFTSTLTPLVGVGVVSIDRMYPLSLGSNIGTTTTGILAALATDTRDGTLRLQNSLRVAMCHLFFNLTAICIWYPIPFMRLPIRLAKFLGSTTSKYRWFALFYLGVAFFFLPLAVFGLSQGGWEVLAGVGIPIICLILVIGVVNLLQRKRPKWLPKKIQNWKFLPLYFRSLDPLDRLFNHMCGFCKMCHHHHHHHHHHHNHHRHYGDKDVKMATKMESEKMV
ncbi:sodium-dependent phosphate transport protein 2B-like isoform X2 [Ostrea edulis]|uniref:sodium-dependent phosphate transport protein 2B-like isoform X2 n=1 Tax=Ostrea edulis TaxID=37623 RepID=UPI0024AF76C8|nr:sodium-dependent phosphate transport protein 2B-like isoform X2 [Ostrea edulis]